MTVEKGAPITACGSGMGTDAARKLAEDGFKVGILSSSGKCEAVGGELGGFGVTGSNLDEESYMLWSRVRRIVGAVSMSW